MDDNILNDYGNAIIRIEKLRDSIVRTNEILANLGVHDRLFSSAIHECTMAKNGLIIEMNTRLKEIGRL